jgi:hypothetical protein
MRTLAVRVRLQRSSTRNAASAGRQHMTAVGRHWQLMLRATVTIGASGKHDIPTAGPVHCIARTPRRRSRLGNSY